MLNTSSYSLEKRNYKISFSILSSFKIRNNIHKITSDRAYLKSKTNDGNEDNFC